MASNVVIDLSNYKDRIGARVEPGKYKVVVDDVEQTTSKSSGNPMINLFFRVSGGEFDGAMIPDRLVLTEKSLFRVVGFMQAINMKTPKKRLQIDLDKFLGKVLMVEVDDGEPYNGRVKSEVRGYVRVPKTEKEDVTDLSEEATTTEEADTEETEAPAVEEEVDTKETEVEDSGEIDLDSIEL